MNIKYFLTYLAVTFVIASSSCQESATKNDTNKNGVPEVVILAFQNKFPEEKVPKFKLDSHGYWEGHFKQHGEKYRVDFHADGTWRETENNIKYSALPKVIREKIKITYALYELSEVEHVRSATKGEFYDVEFKRKGKNMDIMFRKDGTIIEE